MAAKKKTSPTEAGWVKQTHGEKYGPAMTMTTTTEADSYLSALIDRAMADGPMNFRDAESQELANIRYFAGYHPDSVRQRVVLLFGEHVNRVARRESKRCPRVVSKGGVLCVCGQPLTVDISTVEEPCWGGTTSSVDVSYQCKVGHRLESYQVPVGLPKTSGELEDYITRKELTPGG